MFLETISYFFSKLIFFAGAITGKNGSFPKPLSEREEAECITRALNGDKDAKDKLINHNMRLVAHIVKKYAGCLEQDDLISVGSIGLIKAVNTFSPKKGTQLATYTARCIENEILMLLRANKKYKNEVSLLDSVGRDNEGNNLTLIDVLCEKEDGVFASVDRSIESEKLIERVKKILSKREFTIICLRYGLKCKRPYAQREVATFLKISRSYVSRIEKKAIEKLQQSIKKGQFYC